MENSEDDFFPLRVMNVAQNLIETLHQISQADYDSLKVTEANIAEIMGESIERVSEALRGLETRGLVESSENGSYYLRTNREGSNDSRGVEIEISPETETLVKWVAERDGLTFQEAFEKYIKIGLKVKGLDLDEGLNMG